MLRRLTFSELLKRLVAESQPGGMAAKKMVRSKKNLQKKKWFDQKLVARSDRRARAELARGDRPIERAARDLDRYRLIIRPRVPVPNNIILNLDSLHLNLHVPAYQVNKVLK
eukprot:SAG31_NODE_643_length_13291_cov_6.294042_9_plen_112_part_00